MSRATSLRGRERPTPPRPIVHEAVAAHARRDPDLPAVVDGDVVLSRGGLHERASALAVLLRERGVGPGSVVGVCMDRGVDLVVAVLGVLRAGAAYLPLDPTYPADRLAVMADELRATLAVVLVADSTRDALPGDGRPVVQVDAPDVVAALDARRGREVEVTVTGEDLCYVVFTSGSTGVPKPVAVRHAGWHNLLEWVRGEHALDESSSGLTVSSFGFDISQRGLMAPLFCGAALHVLPSRHFDPRLAVRQIRSGAVATLHLAPSTLYALVEQAEADDPNALDSLRHAFVGGEPLHLDRLTAWLARTSCTVLHQYGVAECTDVATSHRVSGHDRVRDGLLPAGLPVDNTVVHLLDGERREVGHGEVGEIAIGGRGVCAGYLGRPALTAERFVTAATTDGDVAVYLTGDRGRLGDDGLVVLGRSDNEVKIRGMRIDLGDVEAGLRRHPSVSDAAVVVARAVDGEPALTAFASSALPAADFDELVVLRDLRRTLPAGMVPRRITRVAALPLTPNGKVDRLLLADLAVR